MSQTRVVFYQEEDGTVTLLAWLKELRRHRPPTYAKCVASIRLLAELGHQMRRPRAEYLGDGLYELRPKVGRVHYRILYFFHGRDVVVLTHGFTKEGGIPAAELRRALRMKAAFERNPEAHSYYEELGHGKD